MTKRLERLLELIEGFDRQSGLEILRAQSSTVAADVQDDPRSFSAIFEKRAFEALAKAAEQAGDEIERECLERAKWYVADLYADESDADALERRQSGIVVSGSGGFPIGFHDIEPRIANEPDALVRELMDLQKNYAVERMLNPVLAKQATKRSCAIRRLGFRHEGEFADAAKGVNFVQLRRLLSAFAADTQEAHLDAILALASEVVGHDPPVSYAHMPFLRRATDFDEHFPRETLLVTCYRTFARLGFDVNEAPNLHVDVAESERKDARSYCLAIDAPYQVHLVLKPFGGREDYATLLHEFGHAWHGALTDASLPFAMRQLPRSHALTETYAFLFEGLTSNPAWLHHELGIGKRNAKRIARTSCLIDLLLLRRYIAKLCYELDYFEDPSDAARNRVAYAEHMTRYTGLATAGFRYLEDLDGTLHCADYLRAWIAESQLRAYLEAEYGEDWFLRPEVGEFLHDLWRQGSTFEVEELVRAIGATPWDLSLLERRFANL